MDQQAKRELDAAVARGIGLNVVASDWPCGYPPDSSEYEASFLRYDPEWGIADYYDTPDYVYAVEGGRWSPETMDDGAVWATVLPVPHYSTKIADAWQVVEKMREKAPWTFRLCIDGLGQTYAGFGGTAGDVYADTAPLAICLAALSLTEQTLTETAVENSKYKEAAV